jgi:hypothetical protein
MNLENRFSFDQLATEAKREVAQRKSVYRRLVDDGRMSRETADRKIALMQAIADFLEQQTQPKLL